MNGKCGILMNIFVNLSQSFFKSTFPRFPRHKSGKGILHCLFGGMMPYSLRFNPLDNKIWSQLVNFSKTLHLLTWQDRNIKGILGWFYSDVAKKVGLLISCILMKENYTLRKEYMILTYTFWSYSWMGIKENENL